ncbi:hypothetical protein [sulfur-oxidizing endosymbiont of Gigantopelta aegis]|uniref:hypothetical protein n=1 Tax=sulfur-oxidizing endosymbiont of Gigantopelta aegis TaxID=2794934 RepID=UPI0018DB2F4D|nr:hypothetical protein [sulfur-oxidizing endosymbiont of Gigantopelta aegis]
MPRTLISKQDEFVFRKKDLGQRIETGLEVLKPIELIEVQILQTSDESGRGGWIYIAIDPRNEKTSFLSKEVSPVKSGQELSNDIEYNQHSDTLTSLLYKMSFSQEKPFLLNAFHWRLSASEDQENLWSPDVTDTMKIRHLGRFLGFAFKRTDDDYDSQLIAVKEGPLRVIRRTENHVKVLWKLKSPALYIDYVMMPDGFVMNSMIDIPFNLSFFFSDLITLTTMDWDDSAERPALKVLAEQANLILPVNGYDSADKIAFNGLPEQQFALSSDLGNFAVRLEIPDDFPIHSQLYLKDAQDEIDMPENIPGQFGNVGFKTTGWENIDTELHHLKFTVCVDKP